MEKIIMAMSPLLKIVSKEETMILNRIIQLQIKSHNLQMTNNETSTNYSNDKITGNLFEYMGELNNLIILSNRK
ncbi:MAG: hypothetical protein HeimC3_52330 [Candidatus Heimdallarchaeota archaeon LC_3]|nr:MAG: hypothetical protein HeimC3_52330 [Candidatus Heimdallarchaeota archaeon LC_3]